MDINLYRIIWTILWLTTICILCCVFHNAYPLLLLFIWVMEFVDD